MKEETMKRIELLGSILFLICLIHTPATAGDFDGSRALVCACMRIVQCGPDGNCVQVSAEDIGLPQFLSVNFEQKTVTALQRGQNQTPSRIKNLERIYRRLIIQGVEEGTKDVRDGVGWTVAISEETGKMVITGSGEQTGTIVFGACIPR
jgi:hypothetical protein